MLDFQEIDCVNFNHRLITHFAANLSEDDRISIITETGILIFSIGNNMESISPEIEYKLHTVDVPQYFINKHLGIDFDDIYQHMERENLSQLISRFDVSGRFNCGNVLEMKPISCEWSPKGVSENFGCVIAVLSNSLSLSIHERIADEKEGEYYSHIANVTQLITAHNAKEWVNVTQQARQIEVLISRAESCSPSAFIWSHLITTSNERFAVLFVAHPNGMITAWKFKKKKDNNRISFYGQGKTSLRDINKLFWKQTSENEGALSYGNSYGQLAVITICNLDKNIEFRDEVIFWNENDLKGINYITSIDYHHFTYLIAVKEELLLIFAIKNDGQVVDEITCDLGNQITGLCYYKDNILLVSTMGKVKKITLNIVDSCNIVIKEETIPLKLDNTKLKTCGLVISTNRIFMGIFSYPCRIKDISRDQTPSNLLIYHDTSVPPLKLIMANVNGTLEKYWDCFEVLRLISYKEKQFPWLGLDRNLKYDTLSLTQLKSLRWIAQLSEKVYNFIPRITEYNIKPYIILHQLVSIQLTVNRMRKQLLEFGRSNALSTFKMRSMDISNMFLKEMVLSGVLKKAEVGERFIDEITWVMERANELEYPDMPVCFWCEKKIIGPSCIPPHADSRCVFSMMQIFLVPGFRCPFCGCVAHSAIAEEMEIVTCPFCDIIMDAIYSKEKVNRIIRRTDESIRNEVEYTLTSDVPQLVTVTDEKCFDDVGENTTEYIALSDSDDEECLAEQSNYLRERFFDMMNTNTLPQGQDGDMCDAKKTKENENSDYSFDEEIEAEEQKVANVIL